MNADWTALIVFSACYVLFAVFPSRRAVAAGLGSLALLVFGVVDLRTAFFEVINWNVLGLFCGTLVLAELFMLSRAPAALAELLVDRARTARTAMVALCALSGVLSAGVDNVAVVLLIAPVALSLAEKLKIRPAPLLMGVSICSNLQGTATMIGDPPSMIFAGHMRMSFFDFFFFQGKPGIFFAVQIGFLAALGVLALVFRGYRGGAELVKVEKVRSWMPACLFALLVSGLTFATVVDTDFMWFAGTLALSLALVGLMWFHFHAKWGRFGDVAKTLDWDTALFLAGVFVLVGAISRSGWLERLSELMVGVAGGGVVVAFFGIVIFSAVVSGFVDNIPFLLTMLPVAKSVAEGVGAPEMLISYGLLVGACLGGNLTPIGASANVVTMGILRKKKQGGGFGMFMAMSVPITIASVAAASAFLWLVFGR
ncbi:MAG: arsenic transporter [Lentisphaerae bacterium]|nr:arsenic transporter [Lentisphaerota bacterium]